MISRSPRWMLAGFEQIAAAPPHQKFRPPRPDRVAPPPPRRRLALGRFLGNCGSAKISLHICQADAISSRSELTQSGIVNDGSRCSSTSIWASSMPRSAMPRKSLTRTIDRHPHAVDGTAEHDAFAMKFDLPHAAVGADVVRVEADGQRKRVEPQCAARPGGIDPACCCLTPHGFVSPPGLCSRSIRETMPSAFRIGLKRLVNPPSPALLQSA